MSKLLKHRPLRAAVAGCVGALVLAASMGGTAFAAPVTPHNIDPDATANLVVVKMEAPSGDEGNGLVDAGATNDPVAGVTFKVQKVTDIDLTTNAGWTAAAQLTVAQAKAGNLDAGVELTTGANGVADFEGLEPGLYLVTETAQPADVTPAAPFLVTLPMTDPTDTSKWILDADQQAPGEAGVHDYYQVTVYPKNSIVDVDKSDDDGQAVELGDDITYTLTGDIPEIKGDLGDAAYADSVSYAIADNYDAKLTYLSTDSVKIVKSDGTEVATLAETTDYTSTDRTNKDGSHSQVVTLTVEGLKKLQAAGNTIDNDVRLVVEMTFEANATGELVNTATVYPNKQSQAWTPGETSPDIPTPPTTPPVVTKWGGINIHKTNAKDGSDLANAEFQVYALFGKAGNETFTKDDTKLVDLNADGIGDTFKSVADGSVVINGLRYSDFANNAGLTPDDDEFITYWLVETKAPDGFELLAKPIKIVLTDTTADATASIYTGEVANSPHNGGFQLPLTGGSGTLALTVGGVLVLGGAVVLIVRSARRRAAN